MRLGTDGPCTVALAIATALAFATGCYESHRDPTGDVPVAIGRADAGADAGAPVSPCAAQDAVRTGVWASCMTAAPFYWNGRACMWIGECACVGADCGHAYASFDECMDAHATCFATARPCSAPTDCADDEYCRTASAECGASGVCRPRPAEPLDCGFAREEVCECGRRYFGNRCRSHLLGGDAAECP